MQIYVGNLTLDVTEDDLRKAFVHYGRVSAVRLLMARTGDQHRGFGFVEMPNQAEAESAIRELNRKDLKGKAIKVSAAQSRYQGSRQNPLNNNNDNNKKKKGKKKIRNYSGLWLQR